MYQGYQENKLSPSWSVHVELWSHKQDSDTPFDIKKKTAMIQFPYAK